MRLKKTLMVLGGLILVMSVLFGIYFGNKRQKLIKQETVGSQEKVVVKVGNKENVQEKQTIWKVLSWDWQKSQLKVEKDAKKEMLIKIDLTEMKVMIPFMERDKRQQFMPLNQNEGKAWETAFCNGDEVNVGTDSQGKVILVINIGSRICGSI